MCQYLTLSHYAPKKSHNAQLCSHLFGYHYAENYASIIRQGLADNDYPMRMRQQLQMPEVRPLYIPQLSVHHAKFIMSHVQTRKSVQAGKLVTQKVITPENLICRPCWDDVHRMVGNPECIVCA